jgi:chromosome segregation ATPase
MPGEEIERLERALRQAHQELEQLRARAGRATNQLRQATIALERTERELARLLALEADFERSRDAQYWLDVLESSLSWRITAPLRRLSALAERRARRGR